MKPSVFSLRFLGVGEAVDPRFANTSLLIQSEHRLLIDCGYSVPNALWAVMDDAEALEGIYLSHSHADHCFGLPALLLWMRLSGRRAPLDLFTGPGGSSWGASLLESAFPGAFQPHKCFPLRWHELQPGVPQSWGELTLQVARSAHSPENYALRVDGAGKALGYSGDGGPTPETHSLYTGVDWLVHECGSLDAPRSGHACLREVLALARDVGAGCLAVVHLAAAERSRAELLDDGGWLRVPGPGEQWTFEG